MSSRLLCRPLAIGETTYRCWSNILRNAMQATVCCLSDRQGAAQQSRRHTVAGRISYGTLCKQGREEDQEHPQTNARTLSILRLAGQHSRIAKRDRASRDFVRWPDFLGRRITVAARIASNGRCGQWFGSSWSSEANEN